VVRVACAAGGQAAGRGSSLTISVTASRQRAAGATSRSRALEPNWFIIHLMCMDAGTRAGVLVAMTVLLDVSLSGCEAHDHPPRSVALSTVRATDATMLHWSAAGAGTAAVRDGSLLVLQHGGSSTCPGIISNVRPTSPTSVEVTIWSNYKICSADAVFFLSRIRLPETVRATGPLEVTVERRKVRTTITTSGTAAR
jgi:hypothetical protein